VLSAITDPPNPRLSVGTFGKSVLSVFQLTMLELPIKSTAPCGGGVFRSAASNRAMADSQRIDCGSGAGFGAGALGGCAGRGRADTPRITASGRKVL
jgi:hypothetical protein